LRSGLVPPAFADLTTMAPQDTCRQGGLVEQARAGSSVGR